MSEAEFKIPRKFTFDEYYEMLKEFVNDPKAREYLAIYDAEDAEGRGNLYETSCSELADESYGLFTAAGWSILVKNGWPTFPEVVRMKDRDISSSLQYTGYQIWKIGQRLIRKEPVQKGFAFQDEDFDINDRESVRRLLEKWTKKYEKLGVDMPFYLSEKE